MIQLSAPVRRALPFMIAGILGLLAVAAFEQYRQRLLRQVEEMKQKLAADYQAPVDVIVAKKDIAPGSVIALEDLQYAKVPEKFVQPYATQNGGDLIGLVAIAPIAEKEQVLTNKLRRANELPPDATLSGLTPQGLRAITIGVNSLTGVGGFVRPGDTVDVLWTLKLPENQGGESITLTLFQNISVLAVGSEMVGRATTEKEASDSYSVTLALTLEQASLLLYARQQAGDTSLQLALRARSDTQQVAVGPATSQKLMDSLMGKPKDQPPPKPQRNVEIYKGPERTVVSIPE